MASLLLLFFYCQVILSFLKQLYHFARHLLTKFHNSFACAVIAGPIPSLPRNANYNMLFLLDNLQNQLFVVSSFSTLTICSSRSCPKTFFCLFNLLVHFLFPPQYFLFFLSAFSSIMLNVIRSNSSSVITVTLPSLYCSFTH